MPMRNTRLQTIARHRVIEAVVECLVGLPEGDDVVDDVFGRCLFDEKTGHKSCDSFHVCLMHAKACDFGGSQAETAGMIPVFWLVGGDQVLVRDDVGACQPLGDFQATAKLAHVGYDLMG